MASPYFSQINVQQADYSPLVTAGANIGRMYADMGKNIGQGLASAIGSAGSKYFEDKKTERAFAEHIKTDEGMQWAISKGFSETEVKGWREDPTKVDKAVSKMVKDIGMDKLREDYKDQLTLQMAQEKHRQANEMYGLEKKQKEMAIAELDRTVKIRDLGVEYQKHLYTKSDDGRYTRDLLDPTAGFDLHDENGQIDPLKVEAVKGINKSMNLGRYSPAMVTAVVDGFRKKDVGGSGELLKQVNFLSESSFQEAYGEFTKKNPSLPPETLAQAKERLRKLIVPEGGVRKIIDNAVEKSQFGAFLEKAKTQVGTMGNFSSLLAEATTGVEFDQNGNVIATAVKNPVAASVVLMQLARMAQGAGVLSNQDVNLVRGSQTYGASYERFIEKRLGDETELTKQMFEQNPVWSKTINPDTGSVFKVGDEVIMGGANLSAADLGMFKEIASAMDRRFKQVKDVAIPEIYDEVRAIYGGLTTEEIHTQSDLDVFYPDGFQSAQSKLDGVDQSAVDNTINMLNQGYSPEGIKKYLRSQPSFDASVGDEQVLDMTLKIAKEQRAKTESSIVNPDPQQKQPEFGNMSNPDIGEQKVKRPDLSKEFDKRLQSQLGQGSTVANVTGGGTGSVAGTIGGYKLADKIGQKNVSPLGEKIFARKAEKIKTGSFQDLKDIAKKQKLNTNKFRGNEAGLRKELGKRLEKEMKSKLAKWAGKQGFSQFVKKGLATMAGATFGGGVGIAASSTIYEILNVATNEERFRKETYDEMLRLAKTEEERDVIKQMKKEYEGNLARSKPRFEGGVYKGIGSSPFGK